MKPTQAQIELRRLAFRSNNDWPRSKTCLVCGQSFSADGPEYHKYGCAAALTAAAEVAPHPASIPVMPRVINHTIERCAQVIKEWFEKADPHNTAENMPLPVALIAAIRALKDKP